MIESSWFQTKMQVLTEENTMTRVKSSRLINTIIPTVCTFSLKSGKFKVEEEL